MSGPELPAWYCHKETGQLFWFTRIEDGVAFANVLKEAGEIRGPVGDMRILARLETCECCPHPSHEGICELPDVGDDSGASYCTCGLDGWWRRT
jgi:hypothetical protein